MTLMVYTTILLVYMVVAAFAFAPQPASLAIRTKSPVFMSRAEDRANKWNPGKPEMLSNGNTASHFTFDSESGIGGGLTAISQKSRDLKKRSERGSFTFDSESGIAGGQTVLENKLKQASGNGRGRQFSYDSESGIAGGQAATATKLTANQRSSPPLSPTTTAEFVERNPQQHLVEQQQQAQASDAKRRVSVRTKGRPAGSPAERITRGRFFLQSAVDERFSVLLAPHIQAFSKDEIDEAELTKQKKNAREQAEQEFAAQGVALDECEALISVVEKADEKVSKVSKQLDEVTSERDNVAADLKTALNMAAV